jgi:hypothetical protein
MHARGDRSAAGHEEMALAFFDAVTESLRASEAEEKASGPAPNGISAACRSTAEDALPSPETAA